MDRAAQEAGRLRRPRPRARARTALGTRCRRWATPRSTAAWSTGSTPTSATRAELRRIAGIFLAQIAPGTRAIAAAAAAGDSEALRLSAHRLGSAGATFGAARLGVLCGRLEALGAAGRADASADLARELEAEAERATAELRALLGL